MKRSLALGLLVPVLAGCSLIGGSGEFTVEDNTYKSSRVSCSKKDGKIEIEVASGAAVASMLVTDGDKPLVQQIWMGAKEQPTMAMSAEKGFGRAVASRSGKSFVVSGDLARADQEHQTFDKKDLEPFNLTVTCGSL